MGQKKNDNLVGQGFHTNPERINKEGRPPKLLSHVTAELKEAGFEAVTNAQVLEAYGMLINLDEARIKDIIANSAYPMFLRIVGKAMLGNKGTDMIERMLERAYGKAKQQTDITSNGNEIKPIMFVKAESLTDAQIEKFLSKDAGPDDESI